MQYVDVKRILSGFLCLVMLLSMIPVLQKPVSAETGYDRGYTGKMAGDGKIYAHGLDVSAWQESGLNFQNFANAGYDYVILRCGTSYGKDKCFEEYYASARAAGLDIGCYYYSYAQSEAEAVAEATEMISWMGSKKFEYPIYFDYEDPSQSNIDGNKASRICYAFMNKLRDNGYLVGLYSMASWLEQSWVTTSGIRNTYEGWVAHLTVGDDVANSGINSPYYDDLLYKYGSRYGMHQYSFSTWVNGHGPFDCNVAFKDYPTIVKTYGFNGYEETESWIEKVCFDPLVYRDRYPDLEGKTDEELKAHWLNFGIKEGRCASAVFDLQYYRENNADLKAAHGNNFETLYQQFITTGYKEQRPFSRVFDGYYYTTHHADVAASCGDEFLRHYVDNGMAEGRRASATFDVNYYLHVRPDVGEAWPGDLKMATRHYAGHGIREGITGYDNQKPVISNVVFSNISASGYTVTCTVTDNWGVSKVAFPTWTLYNDQDDLADNFMNTQLGTKNGNTYTFHVKASDHNNETGFYATHIYAVDRGGNTVSLEQNPVEVKNSVVVDPVVPEEPVVPSDPVTPSLGQITLVSSTSYVASAGLLRNVTPSTSVSSLLGQFENQSLEVVNASGSVISGSMIVGTGTKIKLYENGALVDTVTVVIMGDVDGNGKINTTDYMRTKAALINGFSLDAAQNTAADVDGNGKINTTDYIRIKGHFVGTYDLFN